MTGDVIIWTPGMTLEAIERQVIEKSFCFYRQNKSATARALGITVKTLDNKFERYQKDDEMALEAKKQDEERREQLLHRSRFGAGAGLSDPFRPAPAPTRPADNPAARDGMEPASGVASQQTVSVPIRNEVQGMLPAENTTRRRHRPGAKL